MLQRISVSFVLLFPLGIYNFDCYSLCNMNEYPGNAEHQLGREEAAKLGLGAPGMGGEEAKLGLGVPGGVQK